jgi:energy-coupling factor transport system ATP-binding protein
LVEHKIDLIAEYADDVLVFQDGELVLSGDKHAILSDSSILEKGAALPQVALLGLRLQEQGFPIANIPVTEDEAAEVISAAMKERKTR